MVIQNIITIGFSLLVWGGIIALLLLLAGLKWKVFRTLRSGYFTLVRVATIGLVTTLFKPLERRGIGNTILEENDPKRRS